MFWCPSRELRVQEGDLVVGYDINRSCYSISLSWRRLKSLIPNTGFDRTGSQDESTTTERLPWLKILLEAREADAAEAAAAKSHAEEQAIGFLCQRSARGTPEARIF